MKLRRRFHLFWIEKINLRMRIACTMIFLIMISIVSLGAAIFQISKNTIEKNYQSAHLHNLQVSSKMMDIYLQAIIESGRTLLENTSFINIMRTETQENGYFTSRSKLALDKIINNITSNNSLINGMLVVNESGNWRYNAKSKTYSGYLSHYYTTDKLLEEEWVQTARAAEGREVFFPYDVVLTERAKDCFCYVKDLIDPYTQQSFGFLVVSIDKKIWKEAFGKDTEGYSTNRYMVLLQEKTQSEDNVVYFTGAEDEKREILENYYSKDTDVFLFSTYSNDTTKWSIINVITKQELESDSDYIQKILLGVIFIMTALSIFAAAVISSHITKPLDKLAETMSKVEVGNLKVETEFDNSEVGKIGNRFKSLVNNNLELRDHLLNLELREKDAQLLLLQSQINPHFLYNTLDALYFMALIEQADDIADMVQALSNMFKLSLNKGDKLITLHDEIEHMKDYMKIQNFRFHDRFTLHIDVDEEILDEKILTFILQPILENAVYHGLESKIGPGNISLSVKPNGDNLSISIKDDGVGIEDMALFEKGYAIKNIKERIKLFYGEEYHLTIASERNIGTTVSILIPYSEEDRVCTD